MITKLLRKIVTASIIVIALMPLTANADNGKNDWPDVFPTSDALWKYRYEFNMFGHVETRLVYYKLEGDTIINNISYNKLHFSNEKGYCGGYVGGTRIDGCKVYFKPNAFSGSEKIDYPEFLIFYFADEPVEIETPNAPIVYKEDHFSLLEKVGGYMSVRKLDQGKSYGVGYSDYDKHGIAGDMWIKGIGGEKGFWQARSYSLTGPDSHYYLDSFFYKGKQLYPIPDGVEQAEAGSRFLITVTSNSIKISGDSDSVPPYILFLIDKMGVTVKEFIITDLNTSVTTDGLSSGIYIYRLSGSGINQTGKIIIK